MGLVLSLGPVLFDLLNVTTGRSQYSSYKTLLHLSHRIKYPSFHPRVTEHSSISAIIHPRAPVLLLPQEGRRILLGESSPEGDSS